MDEKEIKIEVIDLEAEKKKAKARERWSKLKRLPRKTVEWVDTHRETAVLIGGAIVGIVNAAHKASQTRRTEEKRYEYYDPHTGAHWQLRRRLTNDERAELMRRQRGGEFTEDILSDMRLLK